MSHNESWRNLKYKNIKLLIICILATILLVKWQPFQEILSGLHNLGYLGAFVGGILFVSTFTVALGGIVMFNLTDTHSIFLIAIVAGIGGVIGDLLIFKFVKNRLLEELEPIYNQLGGGHLTKILHTVYMRWMLPILGALIVASPLPDELGITLMSLSEIKTSRFIALSFILNTVGIFLLLGGIRLIRGLA